METLKTRFNNIKYEHFKIDFKGLSFEVKLLDDSATFPNTEDKTLHEEFKIIVTNKDKVISYKFYNSSMEREITKHLNNYKNLPYTFSQIKTILKSNVLKMWGGYDKVKSLKELTEKRVYYLLNSILCDIEINKNDYSISFKDFCDNFGYEEDSRKAERVYKAVKEQQEKLLSLNFNKEQEKYFNEEVQQETEKFNQDLLKAIQETKQD